MIVGAEVTRRNDRVNRAVRLLTSAPTGFMAPTRVRSLDVRVAHLNRDSPKLLTG